MKPKVPPPIVIRSGVSVKDETGLRALKKELQTVRPASKGTQLGPTPKTPSVLVDMLLTEAEIAAEPVTQLAKKMRSLTTEDGLLISTPKGKLEEPPQQLQGDSGQLVGDEEMNATTSKGSSPVSAPRKGSGHLINDNTNKVHRWMQDKRMCPNHWRRNHVQAWVQDHGPHSLGTKGADGCKCCGQSCDECTNEEEIRQKATEALRVSKEALSILEQSSGEAPLEKLRLVEDQVIAEEEIVADTPLRPRRKRRRRVEGTRDDATVTQVLDSEMETETDMEAMKIDDNDITSVLHPERGAED